MTPKRNTTLVRLGIRALRSRAFRESDSFTEDFIDVLTSLGGVYAKFLQGALLGTLVVKNNRDISKQLAVFENNPDPGITLESVYRELGVHGSDIEPVQTKPIGVGSYSAAYLCKIKSSGVYVVVKMLRPGVRDEINHDLRFLKYLAYVYGFGAPAKLPIDIGALYKTFSDACKKEMDFVKEAEFATELEERYKDHDTIVIPHTYREYCSENIIVQEYIEGLSGTAIIYEHTKGMSSQDYVYENTGSDLLKIMKALKYDMLMSLMSGKAHHGDMHPGNIRILPANRIALIDFGIKAIPYTDSLVAAYVPKLESDALIMEGDFNLVRILDTHFRVYMKNLYASIESIQLQSKKDMKAFFESLVAALDISTDNPTEEQRNTWIKTGSPIKIMADLIGNFKDYGLTGKVTEQSPQRASHTFNSMLEAMGIRIEVKHEVFLRVIVDIREQRPELFQPHPILRPDLAFENLYLWLERITSTNPELASKIRNMMFVSSETETASA